MDIPGASAIRRGALLLIAATVASLPAPVAAAPAGAAEASHHATQARIVQPPRDHAIVTGRSFGVVAALPQGARAVRARIDDRGLSDRLEQRRDGRYAARVPTRLADGPGFHFLLITYADASGRHSLGRELIVARGHQRTHHPRRGPRLLTARAPHHPVAGVARLHLTAPHADQWSVRVNGKDVSDRFADHAGFLRAGPLSASTGLHQGRNQIAVLAARDDGTRAVRRFSVRVRPHTPIPDAGRPRRVGAGDRLRLGSPGGDAEPSRPGDRLEHSWTILAAPKRSEARIRHPRAARPSFRPDLRGAYRIADRVTERTRAGRLVGRSARDVVEVAATPAYVPPIGEPIETFASGAEEKLGIKLGGSFFPLEGGPGAIQLLMIDPTTLTTWTRTFETPEEAQGAVSSADTNPGTIVVVLGREVPVEGTASPEMVSLEVLGEEIGVIPEAFPDLTDGQTEARISFSAIGVKGVAEGQGWINGVADAPGNGATGVLRGYIAPNYELSEDPEAATYAYMPSTYFSYDTNTTGVGEGATSVTAQVGPTKVSGSVPSGQVGFLVAEFDAGDLSLRSSKSFAIAAAGSGEATNRGEVEALATWLEESQFDPDALVLVQSIGTLPGEPPAPPKSKSPEEEERYKLVEAWARAARAIGYLGGHEDPFLSGGGGGYSFLGGNALPGAGVPAAENATNYLGYNKPPVVRLAGTLQLGHTGTLVPATNTPISTPGATTESDPGAVGNFELPLIAYQPGTPWPYEPGSSDEDAAVVAAGHYISEKICDPACDDEVRRLYPTPNFDLPRLLEGDGEGEEFKCPGEGTWEGTDFTAADCEDALAEFEQEYQMVTQLDDYFSTSSDGFLYPLGAVIGDEQAGLEAIGNDVEAAVQADSEAGVHIEWLIFAQTFAIIGDAIPGVSAVSTLIDSGLNMASAFTVDSSGENVFRAETEVDDAVAQIATMASKQQEAIWNLKDIIVTDYGKLSAMATNTSGRYPQWNLPSNWSAAKEELDFGLRGAFYLTFLPSLGGGYETEDRERGPEGFADVVLLQNLCTSFEYAEHAPKAPECGVGNPPEWTTVAPREFTENLACWHIGEEEIWETESMGRHWAGGEYVVPEANAIWEWAVNPYYPLAPGGAYMLAYSPRWQVAISELEHFSSSEGPFPASVAREVSGKPEAGNLAAGLPRWALFESLPEQDLALCPLEWEGAL